MKRKRLSSSESENNETELKKNNNDINNNENTIKLPQPILEALSNKCIERDTFIKPKFLTKEERQALAIKERECKIAEKRKEINVRKNIEIAKSENIVESGMLSAIRSRYLGEKQSKKRGRRISERKFKFEWDGSEDTSNDYNKLYSNKHQVQLYGRGTIAGIDEKIQKKVMSSFYENLLKSRRTDLDNERSEAKKEKEKEREEKVAHDERHWSRKDLQEMTDRDWRILMEDFGISVKGGRVCHPLRCWEESSIPQSLLLILKSIGFEKPTPIQRMAIPIGLLNRDLIGVAETGSGKTAAYIIPLIVRILTSPILSKTLNDSHGPYAVVLAPTRELVLQIEEETKKLAKPLNIRVVALTGGTSREKQGIFLQIGSEIVIATPGRLIDVLENRYVSLNSCTYVILDEADRMIDMGFEEDVTKVLEYLPPKPQINTYDNESEELHRQMSMFTATMPPSIERLAKQYLSRPYVIYIGIIGRPVDRVVQEAYLVNESDKKSRLLEIFKLEFEPPIIIFVNQKKTVDSLSKQLEREGFKIAALHGSRGQEERETALRDIKTGIKDVLVATDVAGRGIDIRNTTTVINYDAPKSIEDYTHRIGRTGRAGRDGKAITFLTNDDSELFYDLKQIISASTSSVLPTWLANHAEAQHAAGTVVQKRRDQVIYLD